MKRRGFLGLLGAAIAAPFVPKPAVPTAGIDLAAGADVSAVALAQGTYVYNTIYVTQQDLARIVSDEIMRSVRLGQSFR